MAGLLCVQVGGASAHDADGSAAECVLVSQVFAAEPDQVAVVRALVRTKLMGLTRFDVDTVELLASELAANAVRHSGALTFRVVLETTEQGRLRCTVSDRGRGFEIPLHLQQAGPEDAGGRGLLLVDRMAHSWGKVQVAGGEGVWFEVSGHGESRGVE